MGHGKRAHGKAYSDSSWRCDWKPKDEDAHWGGWQQEWTDWENWDKPTRSNERRRRRTAESSGAHPAASSWNKRDHAAADESTKDDGKEDKDQLEMWRQLLHIPGDGSEPGMQALPDSIQAGIQQATIITDPELMTAMFQGFARFISLLIAEVSRALHRGQAEQQQAWRRNDPQDDGQEPEEEESALMQMPTLPAQVAAMKKQLREMEPWEACGRAVALRDVGLLPLPSLFFGSSGWPSGQGTG